MRPPPDWGAAWAKTVAFFDRNKVLLLFLVLILGQFLTWHAIVSAVDELKAIEYAVQQPPCGGSEPWNHPCHVVIDKD